MSESVATCCVPLRPQGNLAIALGALGRHDEALGAAERALDIEARSRPERHPARLIALNNLAVAYDDAGDYRGALRCAEQALAGSVDAPPAERLLDLTNVGCYRYRLGELEDARDVLEQGLALARDHAEAVRGGRSIRSNLARVYLELGRTDDAFSVGRRALELGRDAWGEDDPRLADDYQALAQAELASGHVDRARDALERPTALVTDDDSTVRHRIDATRTALEQADAESPEHEAAGPSAP